LAGVHPGMNAYPLSSHPYPQDAVDLPGVEELVEGPVSWQHFDRLLDTMGAGQMLQSQQGVTSTVALWGMELLYAEAYSQF